MMRALRELVEQMRARGLADHARGLAELAQVWYEAAPSPDPPRHPRPLRRTTWP